MVDTLIRGELYHLTDQETDVDGTDISVNQTGLWLQGWKYQVPVGISLVFRPEDTFAAYMEDITTTELTVADRIRISIEDASNSDRKQIGGPWLYTQVSDFTDVNLLRHLDLSKPIVARENDFIIIEVYAAVSLDVSLCYWDLTCDRARSAIF